MSLLPRPQATSRSLVLRLWPTGETSLVASLLTADHGMVRVIARGARSGRSRLGPLLQPGRISDLEFTLQPGRELQFLRGGSLHLDPLAGVPTLERTAYLQAALEIVDRCRPGDGQETGLFPLCEAFVRVLSCADAGGEPALFYAFEVALLDLLGIRPQIHRCAHCDRPAAEAAAGALWLDPAAGGLLCGTCAAAGHGAGARPLPAATLAAWPAIAGAPRRWPEAPLERTVGRDWGILLHRFLEYHLPGYRLPAALGLLRPAARREADVEEEGA